MRGAVNYCQAEKVKQDAKRSAQQAMIEKAKLEQEFQKDLPDIRNYLTNYHLRWLRTAQWRKRPSFFASPSGHSHFRARSSWLGSHYLLWQL